MGLKTNIAALVALVFASSCGKKPRNVIAEWKDEGNSSNYSVEAVDEKARRVTITAKDSTTILYGDGEGDDPDIGELTVGGTPGYFGGAGNPPLPPSSKPSYDGALEEAGRRLDERLQGAAPTPAAPAAPAPTPEPNVLYTGKLGDSDVTLESLNDGTRKLKYVQGDLTWILYDKDGDRVPETGERTVVGSKPGSFGGPNQEPLPSKAVGLYKRTVEAINAALGGELDALYASPPAPATPNPDPATPVTPRPNPDPATAPAGSGGPTTSLDYKVDRAV